MAKTPELDKMLKVRAESQKIGEFLEWLNEQGVELMKQPEEKCSDCYECESCGSSIMEYARFNKEQKLAEFFGIDLAKCEKERQAIFEELKAKNSNDD